LLGEYQTAIVLAVAPTIMAMGRTGPLWVIETMGMLIPMIAVVNPQIIAVAPSWDPLPEV